MDFKQMIGDAIKNINTMADVNTVIGEPISLPNGAVVVPFSKVSVGFANGGADRAPKNTGSEPMFAGGSGAGVSVTPMGFLVVAADGKITLLDLKNPASYTENPGPVEKVFDGANALLDRTPDLISKCKDLFKKEH
ncbi:MAG: sporulation protein YtfJ [Clostridiales bacterium]|nr:sporulation protein YtfJ [Candidatus Coliplasma caballi]